MRLFTNDENILVSKQFSTKFAQIIRK